MYACKYTYIYAHTRVIFLNCEPVDVESNRYVQGAGAQHNQDIRSPCSLGSRPEVMATNKGKHSVHNIPDAPETPMGFSRAFYPLEGGGVG